MLKDECSTRERKRYDCNPDSLTSAISRSFENRVQRPKINYPRKKHENGGIIRSKETIEQKKKEGRGEILTLSLIRVNSGSSKSTSDMFQNTDF